MSKVIIDGNKFRNISQMHWHTACRGFHPPLGGTIVLHASLLLSPNASWESSSSASFSESDPDPNEGSGDGVCVC